ncbi:MAG: type II toxin-antitoxin system VapC family toxin [Thermodesulfobacteriota bacterium]
MKVFFDSSAFAKRYIEEPGSDTVENLCAQATMLGVSSVCLPEMISGLCRLRRDSFLTKNQYDDVKESLLRDFEDISVCNITPSVIRQAIHILETNTLRTLDALHIACALEWKAELFVSSDLKQISAAKRTGLKVVKV